MNPALKTNRASTLVAAILAGIATLDLHAAVVPDTPLGAFNGITCYSNIYSGRPSTSSYSVVVKISGKNVTILTGGKWQCVEYIKRYYAQNILLDIGAGNAVDYYNKASSKGLKRFPQSSIELPKVGDIMCWGGGSSGLGHVAIVREVGSNYIVVIEQNVLCAGRDAAHKISMTVSKDAKGKVSKVEVDSKGPNSNGTFFTQGWLRR